MVEISWNDLSSFERDLLYFVVEMRTVSFINFHQRFPKQFPGKGRFISRDSEGNRAVFWTEISQEFVAVLIRLRREGLLRISPCSKKIYMHDLGLHEEAETEIPAVMNSPHWFPIVYDATEKGKNVIRGLDLELVKELMAREIDYQLKLHAGNLGNDEEINNSA
ncbi:MAG: hypothetical protein ACFFB3_06900 [Candidatus Hodarchaeota archaeon]